MARFHHVNLGVPPGGVEDMAGFLVDVLGYRRLAPDPELLAANIKPNWFETDDGSQVHLSEDPEHRPAARAHVAIVLGDQLDAVAGRLEARGVPIKVNDGFGGIRVAICNDPAGNRWELRDR